MTQSPGTPTVGVAIRRARQAAGITLRDLAGSIQVSAGTMSAIENDKVGVSIARLSQIASALGTETAHLVMQPPSRAPAGSAPQERSRPWRASSTIRLDNVTAAAVTVFHEAGYHGATMRAIAATAQLSVAGVYHHHRSKHSILVSVYDLLLDELQARVAAAAADGTSPHDRVVNIVEAVSVFRDQHPELSSVADSELRSLDEPESSRITARSRTIYDTLRVHADEALNTSAAAPMSADEFSAAVLRLAGVSWLIPPGIRGRSALPVTLAQAVLRP
ncbi:TetR family transcriptional regulator [Aeromicrobium choanae]|uniref:Transcriptional regulator, TetR family n=1 Tax=Aeromicrobium choanae TaxID=1736691 RepID=A0A1T4YQD1_9ACTN|nr:TetR family transcriptional regulator [Aeromicrobium choanae]SKB03930.1 transcriptional regulator, TetR family [Aeromicrobium choanae]